MATRYRHLFGPVASRRFGRSLGVDLVPFKTCTFDCVFCQLGPTQARGDRRGDFVPVDEVTAELDDWYRSDGRADVVTLAGSGEPTLHTRFGDVLRYARSRSSIPVLLMTNSSLLHLPEVRAEAAAASAVKASLSAWDQESFERVNRPDPGARFDRVMEGLRAFRGEFKGSLWIEVFLVRGWNDAPDHVRRIAALVRTVKPDRIHLNTVVRPPAETSAAAVPPERMAELALLFEPRAEPVENAVAPHAVAETATSPEEAIVGLVQRHPCTVPQLAASLGVAEEEASRAVNGLVAAGRLASFARADGTYYRPAAGAAPL